jgi:hypothetical protein
MRIRNSTRHSMKAALSEAVAQYPTDDLSVELKYCRAGTKRYISGTYYRRTRGYDDGKLIRLRVNPANKYPLEIPFKTSEYYTKRDRFGKEVVYQKFRNVKFNAAEDLILAIFLHEFSHYLDHIEGRNGRYKQTKADKFALSILESLQVI